MITIETDEDRSSLINLEKDIQVGGPFASCNFLIRFLYEFALLLIRPSWWALINIIASFTGSPPTKNGVPDVPSKFESFLKVVKLVLLVILFLALLPFALLAGLILLPLQMSRPRAYSYVAPHSSRSSRSGSYVQFGSTGFPHNQGFPLLQNSGSRGSSVNSLMTGSNVNLLTTNLYQPHIKFKIVSGNLCLGPKFMSYANKLNTSDERIGKICQFFTSDSKESRDHVYSLGLDNENHNSNVSGLEASHHDGGSVSTLWSVASKEKVISNHSSVTSDFICLQEVFCRKAAQKLIDSLKGKYPYIVHDVSWPVHDKRVSFLNSGLFMASKYPLIDVCFRSYKDGQTEDKLACKGVLMAKVFLGIHKGKDMVGILSTTHLQAWSNQKASKSRCKQLSCAHRWIEEFRRRSRRRQRNVQERVVFDVVTGDFNFDRTSYYDKHEQDCELLKNYQDPCMDESGRLQNWAIGTELVQEKMQDELIATPSSFQKMLVSELERGQFLASTRSTKEERNQSEDGKRKIDYILYRENPQIRTHVQGFRFYASLAGLSDHIPISTTFLCQIVDT